MLSVEELNKRILSFKFKRVDVNDQPAEVSKTFKKLSGHAIQNWNMLRFLPCFLHDKVCRNEPVWELVLMLTELVQLACAPAINMAMVMRLKDLIEDYIARRTELFPGTPLKPKHHYMVHYPYLITQFGPLIWLWTMRCESKHGYFRKCIRSAQNFKNITLTLAEKHQLLQAFRGSTCRFERDLVVDCTFLFCPSLFSMEVQEAIKACGLLGKELHCTYQVEYRGTKYSKDMFVILGREESRLVFGRIIFILLLDNKVCFLVRVTCSVLEPMMMIYLLPGPESGALKCISVQDLQDYYPLESYVVGHPKVTVIALKHAVLDHC